MSDIRLLTEVQNDDLHLELYINSNQTEVTVKVTRLTTGSSIPMSTLQDMIKNEGITYGVQTNTLKELVEKSAAAELEASQEETYVVAQGKDPANAVDGRIDFLVEPSDEDVRFEINEDDPIDYKNTNLIKNVTAEQHLATIVQPITPENGIDVFSDAIVATEGQPIKPKLGSNITVDEDKLYATCNGRFIKDGEELSVSPVYNVRGDVDLTIGNINFIGSVIVQKDVLDDFSVYAKESLEIGGIAGAANIESDVSIKLNGGMNGKTKGFIRCQGTIESKYLNEVTAVSWGDVNVQKSIMNSVVKTKAKISVPNGSIIGGEASALMGIDCAVIGSDLGTMTCVTAGQDYELQDRLKAYESQLLEIGQEIDRIDRIVGPILADKSKLLTLPVDKKKALKGLLEQLKRNKEEQARIRQESENLQNETEKTSVKEIKVRKILYSGVRVTIGNCKKLIKMEVKGPVRLREDLENDTISITNLTL